MPSAELSGAPVSGAPVYGRGAHRPAQIRSTWNHEGHHGCGPVEADGLRGTYEGDVTTSDAGQVPVEQKVGRQPPTLTSADRQALLRYMLLMRATEERALNLYQQGKVPGSFYDGRGQEATAVGPAFALGPRDRACILHRDLGAHFVRGVTPARVLAQMMGREGGVTSGKDANMHFADRRLGCVQMVSMLPDMALVACGLAIAFQMRREPRVAMTWFGDGATANGQWHEAMNVAGIRKLPLVLVLENNQWAYSTPNELEFAVDPVERAAVYGFPGEKVDGNDVEAVFQAAAAACERAREGGGPTLIEAETMRMHGHGAHDDMRYVPKEMFDEWEARDPVRRYEERLVGDGVDVESIRSSVSEELDRATEWALDQPMPDPSVATAGVFAEADPELGDGEAPWSHWSDGHA
jgi:TPP-dependent pyruvate/acetoin dehydrogenase alpha subunit